MPPLTPLEHAVAGALSSTFSMLAFYPIDVKKTRVQSNDPASASSQERRKKSRRGEAERGARSEERSEELTTLALGMKIGHPRTFVQGAPPLQPPLSS